MTDTRLAAPADSGADDANSPAGGPPGRPTTAVRAVVAVATSALLGLVVSALCLLWAERFDQAPPARLLAVLALVAALGAVVVAVADQLLAALSGRTGPAGRAELSGPPGGPGRSGVLMIPLAGSLSAVAVVLTGVAVLVVVLRGGTAEVASTEPAVSIQLAGDAGGRVVSVRLSFPALSSGAVLDAKMIAIDKAATPTVVARAVVRPGPDGTAVAQLSALVTSSEKVSIEAKAPDRSCRAYLPVGLTDDGTDPSVTCTTP